MTFFTQSIVSRAFVSMILNKIIGTTAWVFKVIGKICSQLAEEIHKLSKGCPVSAHKVMNTKLYSENGDILIFLELMRNYINK